MRKYRNTLFYVGVIGGSVAIMYLTVVLGAELEIGRNIVIASTGKNSWQNFLDSLVHNLEHPLAVLLAQIVTVIFAARLFGLIFKKIGQPTVIGEILAGIVLGPSLLGMYFPDFSNTLFPVESLGNLQFLSQIGLILFMFVIGMELDLKVLKNKAREAVVISHASIVIPFSLGMGLSYFIYRTFAPQGVQFLSFGLFMGIAMSITAFPVLARIVQERGLHKTRLGTIVITCAAADDITAWCLLAAVIAIVKAGSFVSALYIIALAVTYVFLMIKVIRPFLKRVGDLHATRENLSKPIVAIFFLTLIVSSYATEVIGIHALFGAFMAGAIMPDNEKFRSVFIEKVEDVALVLLLPLFFVYTGLRTEIGLLNDPYLWKVAGLIILVAVVGKFVGSAIAAKVVGQNWKDSLTIGALMNTRGLMELVVLNIGYDLGVLTPEIFAMMVIMALVTTFMTGPSLDFINWIFKSNVEKSQEDIGERGKYKILISFGNPERGRSLLRLANGLTGGSKDSASITAMHLTSSSEIHQYNASEYEAESFAPILQEAGQLNQELMTIYRASNDIIEDMCDEANQGNYDLLLMGVGQSIYEGSLLGKILGFTSRMVNPEKIVNQISGKEGIFGNAAFDDRTRSIMQKSEVLLGIFVDKSFEKVDRILVPIFSEKEISLLQFSQKLIKNSNSQITIFDAVGEVKNNPEMKEWILAVEQMAPNHVHLVRGRTMEKDILNQSDLMITSADSWRKLIESKSLWMSDIPSTLILSESNDH